MCKGNLMAIRKSVPGYGEDEVQWVYMMGCALILHFVVVEHIPVPRTDLVAVILLRMLKWDPIP